MIQKYKIFLQKEGETTEDFLNRLYSQGYQFVAFTDTKWFTSAIFEVI